MKPIQTASAIEEKQRKRKRLGGIIIIGLLLLSTLGFAISGTGIVREQTKEGLQFDGQSWTYFVSGTPRYRFVYGLADLDFSNIETTKTLVDFTGKKLFIDSGDNSALQEIALNLGNHVSRVAEACYGPCTRDVPEMTCDTEDILLVVKPSEVPLVYEENNCVFINGDLKEVDAFLYRILGLN